MSKIMVLVKDKSNYDILTSLFAGEHEVSGKGKLDGSIGLVIADYYFYCRYRDKLIKMKNELQTLLPLLLMVTPAEKGRLNSADFKLADELLEIPSDKEMIQMRVQNLLYLKRYSLESEQRSQLFQFIDKSVPSGICILQEGNIVYYNQALCDLFKKKGEELLNTPFLDYIHPPHKAKIQKALAEFKNKDISQNNYELQVCDHLEERWVDLRFSKITYNGMPCLIANVLEITERIRYEKDLQYFSLHDQLTGLYNRFFFVEEMHRLEKGRDFPITILAVDINGLKFINDSMGHQKGDELIQACGKVLSDSLRDEDILARIGGDEFAVLLPETDEGSGKKVVERMLSNIEKHNHECPEIPLSVSIGIATANKSGASLEKTLDSADENMYLHKLNKVGGVREELLNTLMSVLHEKDFATEGHTQRLADLCGMVGEKTDITPQQLDNLLLLAQTHDLGKLGIPDKILSKRGSLNREEWETMKEHSEKGHRIALSSPHLNHIADLILKHHERWDGNGYPLGLKGEEIPVECRILAIVDSFDAMTSDRPYRNAMTKEEALLELERCAGGQFDPNLVSIFLGLFEDELANR